MTDKIEQVKCQCGHPKYTHNVFTGECEVRTCKCTLYSQEPQQVERHCTTGLEECITCGTLIANDEECFSNEEGTEFQCYGCHNRKPQVHPETPDELLPDEEILKGWDIDSSPSRYLETVKCLLQSQLAKCHQSEAAKIKELKQALVDDATDLWTITNAIKKEIDMRSWILDGRGSYAWDDDKYKDETRIAFEAVMKLIANVQHPAQLRFEKVIGKFNSKSEAAIRADERKKIGEYIKNWSDEWDDISSWNVMRRFVSQLELGKFSPEGEK